MYIKRLNNQFCPVALLQRYILEVGIHSNRSLALFRPVRFYKSTNTKNYEVISFHTHIVGKCFKCL